MKPRKIPINLTLKTAIVQSGLSQRAVARRAGIGEVQLSAFIHGKRQLSDDEKRKIARALRRPQSDLFPAEPAEAAAS